MSEIGKRLFRTKQLSDLQLTMKDGGLKRSLSTWDITAMGVGCIIGVGIFVLPGIEAANHAGPAIVLSFLLAALACSFTALSYAEIASMIPVSGSAYTYGYVAFGEIVAWIIGWDLLLEYMLAISLVAVGWSSYCTDLLGGIGIVLPYQWHNSPFNVKPGCIDIPAFCIVMLISSVLMLGVKESARLNGIMVAVKISAILIFIAMTAGHINPINWKPFMPFGISGVFTAASIVFVAYIGFDSVSTAAEETTDPQRSLPIGIISSLLIATILYVSVAAIMTGVVSYRNLGVADPMTLVLNTLSMPSVALLISVAAIAGMTSVITSLLIGQPRILFAMSRDGLLPVWLAAVHTKYRTPHRATLLTGVVAGSMAAVFPISMLAEMTSIGTLFAFVIVCGGVLYLRYTKPEVHRSFRVPFAPVVSTLGIVSCAVLMYSLPAMTWIRFLIWLLMGGIIYFLYGFRRSLLNSSKDSN